MSVIGGRPKAERLHQAYETAAKRGAVVLAGVAVVSVALISGLGGCYGTPAASAGSAGALGQADPPPDVPNAVGDTRHLRPLMAGSLARAMTAAAAAGVPMRVTSGWRSRDHQKQLYEEAIEKYGSPERARRWVLPPGESAHVKGLAVDIGPAAGALWLERNGVHYGLCRRYDNEPWHFERLAAAHGSVCPAREPHA